MYRVLSNFMLHIHNACAVARATDISRFAILNFKLSQFNNPKMRKKLTTKLRVLRCRSPTVCCSTLLSRQSIKCIRALLVVCFDLVLESLNNALEDLEFKMSPVTH